MDTNNFWTIRGSTNGNFTFAHEYSDTFGQIIRSEKHGLNTDDEIRGFRNEAGWNSVYVAGKIIKKIGPILAINSRDFNNKYVAETIN